MFLKDLRLHSKRKIVRTSHTQSAHVALMSVVLKVGLRFGRSDKKTVTLNCFSVFGDLVKGQSRDMPILPRFFDTHAKSVGGWIGESKT